MNDDFELPPLDPTLLKEENDAKTFMNYFNAAKEVGLELEFVSFFIRQFRQSLDVTDACWYAACEWDI